MTSVLHLGVGVPSGIQRTAWILPALRGLEEWLREASKGVPGAVLPVPLPRDVPAPRSAVGSGDVPSPSERQADGHLQEIMDCPKNFLL